MGDKVKVAVRVRPLNRRELDLGTRSIVEMDENQTILHHPDGSLHGKQPKNFAYDDCFWSCSSSDPHFADQSRVYECLGGGVLENAFKGYNACIFAYGQTGSGKSYTMMGTANQQGIIPRLCDKIFQQIEYLQSDALVFNVEVSYMEIYNEKVRDLLDPKNTKQSLRVREHNILGPYVDGLSALAVSCYEQIAGLMEEGNKSRTVAATNMNSESSRSHAVFNIKLTQTLIDKESGVSGEKVSKISLVDLAGSERVLKSGAVGKRLEEGANINKSLTTLGMVISALAEQSSARHGAKAKFVPYRDSVLTWLLKDNLGGNSRTVMIATVSPSGDNYEETLSTLRYADRAKRIENHAVVNEDPNAKIIRELRAEVEALRSQLQDQNQAGDLRERLAESEKLMTNISRSWEERLKETEKIHQERQVALEKMGISVQASGIKVELGKFYLVNLNADPSLNELLVYYLKDNTIIGSGIPGEIEPDIQLHGLGVQPQHVLLTVEDNKLFIQSFDGAKTCVNGSVIGVKTHLRNGYRVLIGNNHFFRVNCPKESGSDETTLNYDEALCEVIETESGNNPIANALDYMERQYMGQREKRHEEDKLAALEKQKDVYERHIRDLRSIISPMTPSDPFGWARTPGAGTPVAGAPMVGTPMVPFPNPRSDVQSKFVQWAQQRDEQFKKSLSKLKQDIVKANKLVREANMFAGEMAKHTHFSVTLQIPAANLRPSKIKKGAFVSEPAILVKRKGKGSQIWSMEKLENKLIDMRELCEEWTNKSDTQRSDLLSRMDPFFESQENHNLIGVANVFLEVLFHDVRLDYHVPIISQQGEVAGRLHVEVYRVKNDSNGEENEIDSIDSLENELPSTGSTDLSPFLGKTITCRIRIKEATNLPVSLSHFVFCQYSFWSHQDSLVVPPVFDPNQAESNTVHKPQGLKFKFDHEKDFQVTVTDELIEYVQEDALSLEVWGHKSSGFGTSGLPFDLETIQKKKSLQDRWAEVTRRLGLWVEIHELNDQGQYVPVEVQKCSDVLTGGVYQLKQGQQRRIVVRFNPVSDHGSLPLVCQHVTSVVVGCICARNRTIQKPLDSYQEADLDLIKDRWHDALQERRVYLDEQIQRLMSKPDKSEQDAEREQALISQWVALTEERNAVYIPAPNSNIPGAPADWNPPPGVEKHIPVVFLNMNSEDMNTPAGLSAESVQVAGVHSILPKEHTGKMFSLPILKHDDSDLSAVASWDSSIHEHQALNRPTPGHERVYAILKVAVRLSHPSEMELIIRKRLCFNVYKKTSITERLMRKIIGSDSLAGSGIQYDLVAHIPKSTLDPEDRATLALMAARTDESESADGESYIEKYTRGISAVESILALDRLRQEVSIKELLARQEKQKIPLKSFKMKRAASLPSGINAPGFGIQRKSIASSGHVEPQKSLQSRQSLARPTDLKLKPYYSGKLMSLTSPASSSKLVASTRRPMAVLDEERQLKLPIGNADHPTFLKEPVRSATVPESLILETNAVPGPSEQDGSLGSSGYGSQILSTRSEESVEENLATIAEKGNNVHQQTSKRFTPPREARHSISNRQDVNGNISTINHLSMDTSTYSDYGANIMDSSVASADLLSSADSIDGTPSQESSESGTIAAVLPDWLRIGTYVEQMNRNLKGVVRYIGSTEFEQGIWVGLELSEPEGDNNGCVQGIQYFSCNSNFGLFSRPEDLRAQTN